MRKGVLPGYWNFPLHESQYSSGECFKVSVSAGNFGAQGHAGFQESFCVEKF